MGLSERLLDGRKLLIKLGNDHTASESARTPKPAPVKGFAGKQPNPESATLFVGNLPFDATEEGLRDLIESNAPRKDKVRKSRPAEGAGKDGAEDDVDEEDGEEEKEEDEQDEVADEDKEEQAYRGGRRSGLRKVRLGAFEDTGKCKGCVLQSLYQAWHVACLDSRSSLHLDSPSSTSSRPSTPQPRSTRGRTISTAIAS